MDTQDLFFALFEGLPRQGPGSADSTQRALSRCAGLPEAPEVLDLGCGGGAQTLELARLLPRAQITAIDLHAPLVARLQAAAQAQGCAAQVHAQVGDMAALDLGERRFDLIWSEGALYNLGLRRGLEVCAGLLRGGGVLAFTEAVWLDPDPPAELRAAFADYPGMGTVADALGALERGGWRVLDHFGLPPEAWWDNFYGPMERRIDDLRRQHPGDAATQAALDALATEPALHRAHGHCYNYQFFIAQRP
jgi:SAM-dependent methyltransferase